MPKMKKGDKHTPEAKEKMAKAARERHGEKCNRWKGEAAGYQPKHKWLAKNYGKASKCEHCNKLDAKKYEWANISGKYKRDRADYIQLCTSCHRIMDYGNVCRRGHEFTPENTYYYPSGTRSCRICIKAYHKKYIKKKPL
jgi:hypothetical protein